MPSAVLPSDLEHRYVQVNGLRFHAVECGSGEPVLLLHGFPEFWYSWRHQITALAPRYRVIAPDLRGYNETPAVGPYDLETLQKDIIQLAEAFDAIPFHLVGHDWGGVLGWLVAARHPRLVRTLTVLNAPHPALFAKAVRRPGQAVRSWYMAAFQLPWLPERLLGLQRYQLLARRMIRDAAPGTFTRQEVRAFRRSWRRQGLGGALGWYRALLRDGARGAAATPKTTVPTLVVWGERDRYLGGGLLRGLDPLVDDLSIELQRGVGHWVQQEAPAEVNRLLLRHIGRGGP